jgi:hypothetical protein
MIKSLRIENLKGFQEYSIELARQTGRQIKHLSRRHRESYLLEPAILSRVLEQKWKSKHPETPVPENLREEKLREFVLDAAQAASASTRARFLADQETFLRLPASERVEALERLTEFFDAEYVNELNAGRIPYKLLDAKQVLKDLRTRIVHVAGIPFSDKEIIQGFKPEEITSDVVAILETCSACSLR